MKECRFCCSVVGWIKAKDQLPPFMEFVEVVLPDKSCICGEKRDFACLVQDDSGVYWTLAGMDEREWSKDGFGIKYWKPMSPDHRGRKPFLRIDRYGHFKIYFKKGFWRSI